MKYNDQIKKKANEVIQLHIDNGLSFEDARKAASVSIQLALNVGLYPAYQSLYQKTLNCLNNMKLKIF